MLKNYVMQDLLKEYKMVRKEMDAIDAESHVRHLLTTIYDDHVWGIAEENGLEFDDVVYDILDEVVSKAEF